MKLTDRAEEIMERLWIELVEAKKEKYEIGILKDDESLKALADSCYVKVKDNYITLTQKGKEEARNCVRRHRLAERLMVDVFDVKKKLAHGPSCKFEHLLHKGLDEHVCTLLGHPKHCPHGKNIPEGDCCKDIKSLPKKILIPLTELKKNIKARISYTQTHDHNMLQKLIAIGALPNIDITLIHNFPSYVFQIGKSQFAVDKELASCIYVRII